MGIYGDVKCVICHKYLGQHYLSMDVYSVCDHPSCQRKYKQKLEDQKKLDSYLSKDYGKK